LSRKDRFSNELTPILARLGFSLSFKEKEKPQTFGARGESCF
jgi:hypothetical protein